MAGNGRPGEIKALAGARALPPLLLVIYHFSEGHHYQHVRLFDVFVTKGYLWVEFFFALSGFILTYVYGARTDLWRWRGWFTFVKTRLARLYPLHLFMLLFILYLVVLLRWLAARGGYVSIFDVPYHITLGFWPFVANLFLVQAWNLFDRLTWNGVSWFVSVEFFLCLIFPVYIAIARGGWWRGALLIVAGAMGLAALDYTGKHALDITFHNGVLRGMSDFAIGVGMANLYRHVRARGGAPLPTWAHSVFQSLAVLALLWTIYHSGWSHQWRDIYVVPPMMLLIFTLSFDRGIFAWLLDSAPLQKLGEWSYAIYIGQTAWLLLIRHFEQHWYPPDDTIVFGMRWADFIWTLEPLTLVLVCVLWGALLSHFIEEPASKALRKWIVPARKHAAA
ncbi:MAG TPA: acyltransferase [Rhizomicrobium sp.]